MTDLLVVLRRAGLTVIDSRVTAARPGSFAPVGILNHHTADGPGEAPSLRIVQHGRSDLPGPLCNLLLSRSGKFHLVCTGRANHAGSGSSVVLNAVRSDRAPRGDAAKLGLTDDTGGNGYFYGIEVENNGRGEPYPEVQLDALVKGNAAICKAHGWSANRCIHHREWTRRKIDMSWRGDLRGRVAALLAGGIPVPVPEEEEEVKPYLCENDAHEVFIVTGNKIVRVLPAFVEAYKKRFGDVLPGDREQQDQYLASFGQ